MREEPPRVTWLDGQVTPGIDSQPRGMRVDKVLMQSLMVCLAFVAACTKPNPNRCCTDEADCTASSIPVGSTCDDGLLCRGHQCIAIPCTSSTACDLSAPYCVAEACSEQCNGDEQCPGFGQDVAYCVGTTCVECRASADCGPTIPVCETGACRACAAHVECGSGVCKPDGSCAAVGEIAFVEVSGSDSADCSRGSPCKTIERATSLVPAREFIAIGGGTYPSTAARTLSGKRYLLGTSSVPPIITRSTGGPIFSLDGAVDARLEHVELSGATAASGDGYALKCARGGGAPVVALYDVTLRSNASGGVFSSGCTVNIERSRATQNAGIAFELIDSTASIDRCLIAENYGGIVLDAGIYSVTNSFVVRNHNPSGFGSGVTIFSTSPGNRIEFNTIADNTDTSTNVVKGIQCDLSMSTSFPNNIVVRNEQQTAGPNCIFPGSVVSDSNVAPLNLKSPDAAPYDYHLTAGSIAIDAATVSTLDHDFDGDARPNGGQRDVGADELVP